MTPSERRACDGNSWQPSLLGAARRSSAKTGGAGQARRSGVDYPRSDTDFWNSYIKYVPQFADGARARR